MRLHNMFKKTGEKITSIHSRNRRKPEAPEGILKKCNKCGAAILTDEVINGKYICPKTGESVAFQGLYRKSRSFKRKDRA